MIDKKFEQKLLGADINSVEEAKQLLYDEILNNYAGAYVDRGDFIKSTAELYSSLSDGIVTEEELAGLDKSGATDDSCIAILEKNIPQRIRMFIWIEGQDVDCTDLLCSLDLTMGIELAGSNQNIYERTKQKDNK